VILARLLRRDIAGVGKKEIRDMPLIGKTLELAGTIFIDRENSASAIEAMKPLVDAMRNQGKSVVISPEGTRSITPKLSPFKKGAFHLAIQAGVPVVPIVIHNAGDVAPKGDFTFRPATVEVDVLPPVDTRGWRKETIDEHVAEVRGMFLDVLGQREEKSREPVPATRAEPGPRKKVLRKKARITRAPDTDGREAGAVPAVAENRTESKKTPKKKALKKKARRKTVRKTVANKKVAAGKASKKGVLKKKALKKKALRKKGSAGSGG
jgi:putative phosphoserine phosphatase/1-acylglycerol-3-phosphate O-acyltransferase